jgi:hypothetical protein
MRLQLATSATLLAAGLASVLVACAPDEAEEKAPTSDFGQQTVAQIRRTAITDMTGVQSLRIRGTVPARDQELDVRLTADGSCIGTMDQGEGHAEMVETPESSFVRADPAFWHAQTESAAERTKVDQMLAKVGGGWIRSPRRAGYFNPVCDFSTMLPLLTSGDSKKARKGDEREIDGELAISLVSSEDGITSTSWITTDAPHRVIKLTQTGGEDAATYVISDYDEPVTITTPSPAEVYDLEAAIRQKAE